MSYIGIPPFGQTVRTVTTITATASQTVFTPNGGYTVGYVDVYYNGVKLVGGADFNASNGTTVVLTAGATANAVVEIVAYGSVQMTDAVRRSGDVMSGPLTVANGVYSQSTFGGTYTDGIVADYTTGMGRISVGAADGLTIYNGGVASNAMVTVAANGNVGVSTTSPASKLHVVGTSYFTSAHVIDSAYQDGLKILRDYNVSSGGPAGQSIQFGAKVGSTPVYPVELNGTTDTDGTAYNFNVFFNGNTALSINKSKTLVLPYGQISFPVAQNASSDPNTLDDYEEGTWTVADLSGANLSLTVNRSHYVKVGKMVLCTLSVTYPTTTSGSTAYLSLPFAQQIPGYYAGNGSMGYTNLGSMFVPVIENAGTQGCLFYNATGGTLSNANLSTKRIDYTVVYIASA